MRVSAHRHNDTRPQSLPGFLTGVGRSTILKPFFKKLPQRIFIGGPSPTRIIADAHPLLDGDPAVADAFYRGEIALAGHTAKPGPQSVFASPPSKGWLAELVGFDWLKHHSAAANPVAHAHRPGDCLRVD